MLTQIESSSYRIIKLLKKLLDAEDWISMRELTSQLKATEHTIQEDINLINNQWKNLIHIENSKSKGVFGHSLTVNKFWKIQSDILLHSVPIKFIKSMFYHPKSDLNQISEHIHVSRSTLYKYLPEINQNLKEFEIQINKKKAVYYLESPNEKALRRFFASFFLEVFGFDLSLLMSIDQIKFIKKRIKQSIKINKTEITDTQFVYYIVLYYVSLIRESQGFHLDLSDNFKGNLSPMNLEDKQKVHTLFQEITAEIINRTDTNILVLKHNLNKYNDNNTTQMISLYLDMLLTTLDVEINNQIYNLLLSYLNDLYYGKIYAHIPYSIFNNRFSYFSLQAEKDNSKTFNQIKYFVNDLTIKTEFNFDEHLEQIVYLFFSTIPDIMYNKIEKKLLIISEYSKGHAEFIFNYFKSEVNIGSDLTKNVSCLFIDDLAEINIETDTVIITNSILINDRYNAILIDDFPSEKNIQDVKSSIL